MDIGSAIARLAALVEFLAGVAVSVDEEHAAAQDARIAVARAMRGDIEHDIAAAYEHEVSDVGRPEPPPIARAIARCRRLELEAALALVAMRLERAIVDYGHAYAIETAMLIPPRSPS